MCSEADYTGLIVKFISSEYTVDRAISNRRTSLELQPAGWNLILASEPS